MTKTNFLKKSHLLPNYYFHITFMAADTQNEFPTIYIDRVTLVMADQLLQCLESVVVTIQDVAMGRLHYGEVVVHLLVTNGEVKSPSCFTDDITAVSWACLHGCLRFLFRLGAMVP